jgi:hypothetical protein
MICSITSFIGFYSFKCRLKIILSSPFIHQLHSSSSSYLEIGHPSSLPASLVFISMTLFVYVAVCSPITLVALPPSPSSSPATLIAIIIALATCALALFIPRQPCCCHHCPHPCHRRCRCCCHRRCHCRCRRRRHCHRRCHRQTIAVAIPRDKPQGEGARRE